MNITSVDKKELYGIVTGKSYDSTHISVEDAVKKYPNSQFVKNIAASDSFKRTGGKPSLDASSIESIYSRDIAWGKACISGYTEDELASHIGGIGKRLDAAHGAGKFTDDEYNELNKSLTEYTEKLASRSERAAALQAAGRDGDLLLQNLSPKEYRSELNSRIEKYLTDKDSKYYCKIDRSVLADKIAKVRYGILNILPRK